MVKTTGTSMEKLMGYNPRKKDYPWRICKGCGNRVKIKHLNHKYLCKECR